MRPLPTSATEQFELSLKSSSGIDADIIKDVSVTTASQVSTPELTTAATSPSSEFFSNSERKQVQLEEPVVASTQPEVMPSNHVSEEGDATSESDESAAASKSGSQIKLRYDYKDGDHFNLWDTFTMQWVTKLVLFT